MATLSELRAQAREHARQLAAVRYLTAQDLAARWHVDDATVRAVPRERLPYIVLGASRRRRYHPDDVERYETRAKAGEFDPGAAPEDRAS